MLEYMNINKNANSFVYNCELLFLIIVHQADQ